MFFHVYIPLEISIEWNIFCFLTANREKQESCIVTVTVVVILFVLTDDADVSLQAGSMLSDYPEAPDVERLASAKMMPN